MSHFSGDACSSTRDDPPGGLWPPGFFSFIGLGLGSHSRRIFSSPFGWHYGVKADPRRYPASHVLQFSRCLRRSSSMTHAIRFHKTGGPEVLVWEEVKLGKPERGEARIRHTAVGLNFVDI